VKLMVVIGEDYVPIVIYKDYVCGNLPIPST
jgi:hypothetical protein